MAEFRELAMSDESLYCNYMKEWIDNDDQIVPSITSITKYSCFEELVHELANNKTHDETVDNTTFFLIDDEEIIGAVNIRHHLNDSLKKVGGHVSYGIRKKYRGKGYGNKILKKALDYLSRIGVQEALITCNADNEISLSVIEHNGGEEIEPYTKEDGTTTRRFLFDIA